jgi:putative effector of murein hydrolase LrgA (UPF0299 family)
MIRDLTILLVCQLTGEVLSKSLDLPLPGPVLGMAGLFGLLVLWPALAEHMTKTARVLLAHLSLLFVPAGVGVVGHIDRLGHDGPALGLAIVVSTALAILTGVGAFRLTARLTGTPDD